MKENDVQLIHRTLSGDDAAFNTLVGKYRKSVHALAWRKVGDFHFAEEITQDAFLQVYKKLAALRNPNQFAGWLYVITNRLCQNWHRKNKSPAMQPLEATDHSEVDGFSYKCYELETRETESAEHRREIVRKLLRKLPESERTVVTLYYLGEMTAKEIGKFLGVSVNTIKSRLQRARKRLQAQKEELLVRETLGSVQLPPELTENIMRQVADLKPASPPVAKPLLPWAAIGATAIVVMLLLGLSNQYLARFQQPYSFEAQAEPTVEIIDALVPVDVLSKPAVRNQIGRAATPSESVGTGLQVSGEVSAPTIEADFPAKFSTAQWTQMNGPQGGLASDIFATSNGTLYARSLIGVYRLTAGATTWTRLSVNVPNGALPMPMAEHANTAYIVSTDEVLASTDNGETWNALGPRPKGEPAELIIIDDTEERNARSRVKLYLALSDSGIFRSTDVGKHWTPLNNGLADREIYKLAAIGNTIFAGTDKGLYRLNSDIWEQLPVDTSKTVHALTVFEDNLYVGTGRKLETRTVVDETWAGRIFRSSDLGTSWTEITPKNEYGYFSAITGIVIAVRGETILVRSFEQFLSRDGGKTWTKLGFDTNAFTYVAENENTFYRAGGSGVYRTTDGGESWHHFMNGMVGTGVRDLVVFNNSFYAHTDGEVVQSVDDGKSWTSVPVDTPVRISGGIKRELPTNDFDFDSKFAISDNVLYGIVSVQDNLRISHFLDSDNGFVKVQGIPAFGKKDLSDALLKEIAEAKGMRFSGDPQKDRRTMNELRAIENGERVGAFVVRDGTFYVEYKRKLFKWKPGDAEWQDTGLIDTGKRVYGRSKYGFKLAVSAETVYVGKRDGRLFQSLDGGNGWRDITSSLPLQFTQFKEILFVDSTAYVATDRGVLVSQTGAYWHVLTDRAGERIVIDRFTVDGISVYGAGNAGVYRLADRGQSERISTSVPDKVLSLALKNDKLYIVTKRHGMFHIRLEEEG